jgi:hypothetical protein
LLTPRELKRAIHVKRFAEIVRQEKRGDSQHAIDELIKVPGVCALREMIGLMDVPDSRNIIHYQRQELWEEIKIRTAGLKPAPPAVLRPGRRAGNP